MDNAWHRAALEQLMQYISHYPCFSLFHDAISSTSKTSAMSPPWTATHTSTSYVREKSGQGTPYIYSSTHCTSSHHQVHGNNIHTTWEFWIYHICFWAVAFAHSRESTLQINILWLKRRGPLQHQKSHPYPSLRQVLRPVLKEIYDVHWELSTSDGPHSKS